MSDERLPSDIDPASRCRLLPPHRESLDESARKTYDILANPSGGSLTGLFEPAAPRTN